MYSVAVAPHEDAPRCFRDRGCVLERSSCDNANLLHPEPASSKNPLKASVEGADP